ncbi:MAG: 4-hydroxy-tetrahydrodipicolinate reductase [Pseudomonadota bacterium]
MTNKTRLAVAGATGRMGRAIIAAAHHDEHCSLVAAFARPGNSLVGSDAGELAGVGKINLEVSDQLLQDDFDLMIDFTGVESSLAHLEYCRARGKKIVIGTTGFSAAQLQSIQQAAEEVPVVLAPNTSVGVNLSFSLLRQAARVLGNDADIEIIESHHRNKVDAPSGTALRMGEVIAETLNRDLAECAVHGREGHGESRDRNTIGFSAIRAGDIIGEHTVLFAAEGERIEISHKASNRSIYASGALRAAQFLMGQAPGLYDMEDVLGLRA